MRTGLQDSNLTVIVKKNSLRWLQLNIALLKQERPIQFDENEFNLAEIPCPGGSKLDRTKLMGVFSIYNDLQVENQYQKTGRKSPL